MCFHAFCQCFRLLLEIPYENQKICQRAISEFSITENRIAILLPLLFRQVVENYAFFLAHIAISAYS